MVFPTRMAGLLRSDSLNVFSFNLPGLPPQWKNLRVPITCLSKKNIAPTTYHDIMEVISWSLRCCATGRFPDSRHDGAAWSTTDNWRAKEARIRASLGYKACLCEVRGDWAFMKEVFGLPAWNERAGICWRCTCTPAEVRDCGPTAAWRTNRLSHYDLLVRMKANNVPLSPLFRAPWLVADCFRIDWLHCADLGADALSDSVCVCLGLRVQCVYTICV